MAMHFGEEGRFAAPFGRRYVTVAVSQPRFAQTSIVAAARFIV